MATVTFHGVRGSCPCSDPRMRRYGGATACVSVQPDAEVAPIVLDLGTGSRMLGEELIERYFPGGGPSGGARADDTGELVQGAPSERLPQRRLDLSVFVTHLHFDHVQGLPFFAPALWRAARLDIYGPAPDDATLEQAFAAFIQPPYFPVALAELPAELHWHELADGDSVEVGSAIVRTREVPHVGRTLGYRVECDQSVVTYLGDHQAARGTRGTSDRVSEAVIDLASEADVLIHDAQFTSEEFAVKGHWGHSTIGYAVEVALAAKVRKLVLFHHDPTHDDDMLDWLGSEAARLVGDSLEVLVAAEGLTVKLSE